MKKRFHVLDVILLILSIVLTVGVLTFFHACGIHDDGGYSTCHWAQMAIVGQGVILILISGLMVLIGDERFRTAMSIAMIPGAVYAFVVPGWLIPLCMMASMRCHTLMQPAVRVLSAAIIFVAAVNLVMLALRRRHPERRPDRRPGPGPEDMRPGR